MKGKYTVERNVQIVIALMKAKGIRKVIASPGTTNVTFVASIQEDPFFEVYSVVDERSAAYIACGMAAETGETIALSCTGATASRNYMPGLTEAFYRKLPILVITSSRKESQIGHNIDQVTDRRVVPADIVKMSVQLHIVHDKDSEWACNIAANKALLELNHHGKGPVHINLETEYNTDFSVMEIPAVREINRISVGDKFPEINVLKTAIMVGAHQRWSEELTNLVENFCLKYNGVVLCDQISNYKGKYKLFPNLAAFQTGYKPKFREVDLLISIGDVTSSNYHLDAREVWRVNPDGELRDTYGNLKYVFEMEEEVFFRNYQDVREGNESYYLECKEEEKNLFMLFPDIPFSNPWIAKTLSDKLPDNAILHLGIRNSLRSWNYFETPKSILAYSNTGGFGIDGCVSSAIGASILNNNICFCVVGDLAFFYDMNSVGNRHLGSNLRILLINNGTGMEMQFSHYLARTIGAEPNKYIAATGHYGNKSSQLVQKYAEGMGFEYLTASSKEEFLQNVGRFVTASSTERPLLFEVFTSVDDENEAFESLSHIKTTPVQTIKETVKSIVGEEGVKKMKKIMGR